MSDSSDDRRHPPDTTGLRSNDRGDGSSGAATGAETVTLKIYRYDPDVEAKQEASFETFEVPIHEGMTILDALIEARDEHDPSLTFRHSCRQGVCGSDALFVNGKQRLGCKTQLTDLKQPIRIEPLPHQPVVKDLVVDMDAFYERMHAVEPYFDPDDPPPGDLEERKQSPKNREEIKLSTRCIWCGACTSSCTIASDEEVYLGPAAINKGYRFYADEREGETRKAERLEILKEHDGVWRCQTQFSCTTVCPQEIPITEHIQQLKRDATKADLKFW
ncbi:MAG: succinate dehydrogenase/fumarate reductase iron-sulfur subunit [Halodesulfurarchaeum sp.]|nr:succinate dehydrogenase/fumarate reductase iron-sulfur subunit [Halodesulfurarchaeum sp.]